jgi:hypothetical protein
MPHIWVEKAQRLSQVVRRDVHRILTSIDMRGAEPPAVGGFAR